MSKHTVAASISRRGIRQVHHFIGLRFLANVIRRNGLWCAEQLREWGDDFDDDRQKWGSWQKGEEFASYISCGVNSPMGMMKRSTRPVILALSPEVAAWEGVIFIGKWSSHGDIRLDACREWTGIEYFDKMFLHDYRYRAIHPGELLVPEHIPLRFTRKIIFYCGEDLEEARRLARGIDRPDDVEHLHVVVDPVPFGRVLAEEED